jgi:adenylate kinase
LSHIKDIFIFIGPPGSGKGSIASLCIKRFGWLQVSTGNLCRKHIAEQTKIGKEIDLIVKSGKLIGDDLVSSMVTEFLQENAHKTSGVIIDGYPRTAVQAQNFDNVLKSLFPHVKERVVFFVISDNTVISRLTRRFVCQNKECQTVHTVAPEDNDKVNRSIFCTECNGPLIRRPDDEEVSIRKRLDVYHQHAQELMDFYRNNNIEIIEIDVEKPLDDVLKNFLYAINEL